MNVSDNMKVVYGFFPDKKIDKAISNIKPEDFSKIQDALKELKELQPKDESQVQGFKEGHAVIVDIFKENETSIKMVYGFFPGKHDGPGAVKAVYGYFPDQEGPKMMPVYGFFPHHEGGIEGGKGGAGGAVPVYGYFTPKEDLPSMQLPPHAEPPIKLVYGYFPADNNF